MRKLDHSRPLPTEGLNIAGALAEIRGLKENINTLIDEIEEVKKVLKTKK